MRESITSWPPVGLSDIDAAVYIWVTPLAYTPFHFAIHSSESAAGAWVGETGNSIKD
jgi:hypothetical protein